MTSVISQAYLEGKNRSIDVSAHESGTIGVSVSSYGGDYMRMAFHLDRADAIKLRDMLDGAISNTAPHDAPSHLHPVMAEATFLGAAK